MREENTKANNPMVSICMVTYNHQKWIAKAIEGVLLQQCSFKIELVIGDDCSTDNTQSIVNSYQEKYPELIRVVFNKVNVGLSKNFSELLNQCAGKYIAVCEGDDFWTDAGKLEKQVHFMEQNPEYVICSHNCLQLFEADQSIKNSSRHHHNFSYNRKMFLTDWVTLPLTCMVRNIFGDYTRFNNEGIFCDVIFFYELLTKGLGYFMPDNMATFRVHKTALSSGLSNWQWQKNNITMYDYLYKYHPDDKSLQKKSAHYCMVLYVESLKNGTPHTEQFEPLAEYYKRTPKVVEKIFIGLVKVPYYILKFGLLERKKMSLKSR